MRIDGQQPIPLNAKDAKDEPAVAAAAGQSASAHDPAYVAKATKASVEFERFFVANMLKQMRSSTREMAGEDSVFKDRVNQDMQDMADDLLAGHLAGQRAFGVADAILRQLLPTKKA